MAQHEQERCWLRIPLKERLKIQLYSFLLVFWALIKYAFELLWKSEKKKTDSWDRPPSCLTDNALGYHSYVKLQGVKLHYVVVGDKNLPLALMLHGFPDCWLGWRHQMRVLSHSFRVVAVDLKGFGDSDKPIWRTRYTIDILISEILELINSLDYSTCTLIAHDLGAHIGWYFVSCYPDVVDKFVAISCPHPNVYWDNIPVSSQFNLRWFQFCQIPFFPEMEARKNNISMIDNLFSHLHLQREEKLKYAYKYAFSRSADWTGPINYYRNLPFYRIKDYVRVEVPTMLILGNKDTLVPLESIVKSTEYVSKFKMKIVENSGHFPHQDNPNYVNKLLLSFLTVPTITPTEKTEPAPKGIIGSLYSNTMKYGNSLVDGVMKTTNGVVRLPSQMLKHSTE